ncbi:MAG: hypothetical protein QME81_11210, partial [bacterium]|nr:hypothetical protein [bacterium]
METTPDSGTLVIDITPPHTTNLSNYTDTNDNTPTYFGQATDTLTNIVDIEYRVEGATTIPWTDVDTFSLSKNVNFKFTTSALNDGSNTISTRAKDSATNIEISYASDTLLVDVTPPNTTLSNYGDTNDSTPTYYGEAKDSFTNIVDIEYRVDTGAWTDVAAFAQGKTVNFTFTTVILSNISSYIGENSKEYFGQYRGKML